MACRVALKRSFELDPHLNPESTIKRRRESAVQCPLFHSSPPRAPAVSPVVPVPVCEGDGTTLHKVPSDELEAFLRNQIRSSKLRRFAGAVSPVSPSSNPDSDGDHRMDSAPSVGGSGGGADYFDGGGAAAVQDASAMAPRNQPVFTLCQVKKICERLLKEQESRLRAEYETALNARLAEQYDTFVRFTYDQIHRRFDDTPISYLS